MIQGSRSVLNREALGLDLTVFMMIKTHHHSGEWSRDFRRHVESIPEVTEFHRIGGEWDYLIRVVTTSMSGYDKVYIRLIEHFDLATVTGYFFDGDDIRGQAAHGATDPVNDEQSAPRARTVRQATGNRTGRAMKDGRQQQDGETFRDFLDRLRAAGELVDLTQPVDIRHIATLVDQSDKALMFHDVIGYDMPVVSGIIRSQKRAIMSMGCATYPRDRGQAEGRNRRAGVAPSGSRHRARSR